MRLGIARIGAVLALAIIGVLRLGNPAEAQPQFLKATATAPKTVTAGQAFTLTVSITVDKEFHIQANPAKENYIPTEVKIAAPAGFTVGKITYPAAKQAKISGDMLPVYEGTVQVKAQVTAAKTAKAGKVTLPVTIRYQGCNDKTCFPPKEMKAEAATTVSAGKAAAPKKK